MNDSTALNEDLAPMGSKKVAVVIGRFNPPTRGHYKVIDEVKKFIRANKGLGLEATPFVVIIGGSKTDADKKRNPLTVDERLVFMRGSGNANGVSFYTAPNAFKAFETLREKGFEPIAVAAGTDRIQDYIRILDEYFKTPDGQPIKHYRVKLDRDESALSGNNQGLDDVLAKMKDADVETDVVSGSLARRAVELGFEPEFAKIVGLENKPDLAKKLYAKIAAAVKE
jgi:hypothetical protein